MVAQALRDHLRQACQRRVDLLRIGRIDIKRMFVTDRLWVVVRTDLAVEPSAGILTARLPRQRQPPFAELLGEKVAIELCQIADLLYSEVMQVLLRHLADAWNLP